MLYRLDFTVEYDASMAQQGLLGVWAEEADAALGAKSAGVVRDLWKVVGERKVLAIVDVETPDDLDRILFDLPIMQKMGRHVQVEVTSLRRYEDFATTSPCRNCSTGSTMRVWTPGMMSGTSPRSYGYAA